MVHKSPPGGHNCTGMQNQATCTYVGPVAQGDKVACSAGTTFVLPKWENGEGSHYGKADGDDKTCQACPASTTSTGRKCTCSLACAF